MLTNNGKALCFCSDYIPPVKNESGVVIEPEWNPRYVLLRTNGQQSIIERVTRNQPKEMNYNYLANNIQIVVGSGTNAPAVTDISLQNEITSLSLVTEVRGSRNAENPDITAAAPLIMHAIQTFYNSGKDDITIREIGLITKDGLGFSYLLAREVLSESIPLGSEEAITFSFIVS